MSRRDLKRIEENVDAELAMAESTLPIDVPVPFTTFDPTDPLASDPTDVLRYEIELSGLRDAVLGMEKFEDDLGSA
jgi:hypothetical protein